MTNEFSVILHLVRHGETYENTAGIIQGQLDTHLNKSGELQAQLVGEAIKDIPFFAAFTSDLQRAANTAKAIVAHHPSLTLVPTTSLRERSFGPLEGTCVTPEQRTNLPATVESHASLLSRAHTFYGTHILPLLPSPSSPSSTKHVLVVSHGAYLSILTRDLLLHELGYTLAPGVEVRRFPNTGRTTVGVREDGTGVFLGWGDVQHLEGARRTHLEKENADTAGLEGKA